MKDFAKAKEVFGRVMAAHQGRPHWGKELVALSPSSYPRESWRRFNELRNTPVLDALARLSEERRLSPEQEGALLRLGPKLIEDRRIGFVLVDRSRASDELRRLAISAFRLELVESEFPFDLYAPR